MWAVDRQTAARNNVTYEGDGLLVVQLDSNGPAAQAGLVEGDTIAQIDGKDITTLLELKNKLMLRALEIQFWYPILITAK